MKEIWKDINGYEGLYQVSNLGNVRSIDRVVLSGGRKKPLRGVILKQTIGSHNYNTVVLSVNGNVKTKTVHRLVAIAFIPNNENKPEVNHKKGDRRDNRACRLEWVTPKENSAHAKHVLDAPSYREGARNIRSIETIQISADGFILNVYESRAEAAKEHNVPVRRISEAIIGKRKYVGGFIWK